MLNIKLITWSLGLFGAVTFVVCVLFGLVVPPSLHMSPALEVVLPGFRWLTIGSFVLGLIESFLYGVFGGVVFGAIHNALYRRWGGGRTRGYRLRPHGETSRR